MKLNEIKRIANKASPFELLDKSSLLKNSSEYTTKKPLLKQITDTKKRRTKREVVGDTSSESSEIVFLDDSSLLGDYLTMNFRIIEINIYHNGFNKIYGFKAVYLIDGETVQGLDNVMKNVKNLTTTKISTMKMEAEGDNLKFITGFHQEFIEYIKLESIKGESMIVGGLTGEKAKDLKEFCIDVKKEDLATVLFGGVKLNSGTLLRFFLSFF